MKNGWTTVALDDVCEFENGDRGENYPSRSVQTTEGVPFINAGHLTDDGIDPQSLNFIPRERFDLLGNGKIRRGDILFCLRGSLGKFASVGTLSEGAIASSLVIVRPNESVLNEYILAYFGSDLCSEMISRYRNGAAQPNLSAGSLRKFLLPLPPLAEQRRIVGILDEAFEGLATAKANAQQNLQNARALFESHLQAVFTQRGHGWVEKNLGDLCQIKTGKKDVNEGNPDGKYPFFTCAAAHTFSDDYSFDTEALLVAGNGNVGQVSYYSGKFEAYQRTYVLSDLKGVTAKYLFRVLDKRLRATVSKQKLGNTMPYIKIGMLTDFVVPVPPPKEQALVAEHLDAFAEETQRLESLYQRKLAALDELKKSLLHRAFSGEL